MTFTPEEITTHVLDRLPGTKQEDLLCIPVETDAMKPTLHPSDWVYVDKRCDNFKALRDGIYLLGIGKAFQLRRLQLLSDHTLQVAADNHHYKPYTIRLTAIPDDVFIIGKVVFVLNKL